MIWPWSRFAEYDDRCASAADVLRRMSATVQELRTARSALAARVESLGRDKERLETELASVQSDFRGLVNQLAGLARAPHVSLLGLNDDPFAEDTKQPDDYLTPPAGEAVDVEALEHALDDAPKGD